MKIVLSGIFLGLLLMVVPLYIDYRFRLHLTQKLATSIGRLAFLVAVMALVVYGGVMIDSVVYDIAMGLLFCVFATWMTLYKAGSSQSCCSSRSWVATWWRLAL